jgi:two-component system, chemotaxis family, CheB/CheR fusion protein
MAIKQRVMESGKGSRQNVRTTIGGKTIMYDLTIEPLRDSAGTMVGITCASLDVTGQQSRERKDAGGNGTLPLERTETAYDKPG